MIWNSQDILQYTVENNLQLASVYGDVVKDDTGKYITTGVQRTGCMWCLFGIHMDSKHGCGLNRIQLLQDSHPHLHTYCTQALGLAKVMDYLGFPWKLDSADAQSPLKQRDDQSASA